jgi:MFS transporter, DHA1 family, tetracycline resistance protein
LVGFVRRQLAATSGALKGLKGNARAIAVTEPFFSLSYALISTYASIYMLNLGCSPEQIGLISSVGLALAMFLSLVGGSITDRFGRRRTTLIFDLLSWGGATLIWAFARSFIWFLAAAIVNSLVHVAQTSWTCLFVEDTPPGKRMHVYAWIYLVSLMAGLAAPVSGLFVQRFGLVPAMRGIYLSAFFLMVGMFIVRNAMVTETRIGRLKLHESRSTGAPGAFKDYLRVFGRLMRSPLALAAFLISILVNIHAILKNTFLSLLLTQSLGFSDASIALFPAVGAAITIGTYLLVLPSLSSRGGALPMAIGTAVSALGVLILVVCPEQSYALVIASTVLTAAGSAVVIPYSDTLVANAVEENDRSKAMSIFYVILFAISSPFGYIGGLLFGASGRLPFLLGGVLLLASLVLCLALPRLPRPRARED